MFPSLYILGYCIFATYSTFQLLSSPDSLNLFFAIQMLVCHNQSNFFCRVHLHIFVLQMVVLSSFFSFVPNLNTSLL
jgi:hypothetical protein